MNKIFDIFVVFDYITLCQSTCHITIFITNSMIKIIYHQSLDGAMYISKQVRMESRRCLKSFEYFQKGQFCGYNYKFLYKCNNVLLYILQVC